MTSVPVLLVSSPGSRARAAGDADVLAALLPAAERASAANATWSGACELAGRPAYVKGSPLAPRPAARHAAREALLRVPPPRLAEHANLLWLRAHGFDAPRPLAAVVLVRRGLPRYQALATELVPGARTAREALARERDPAARAALVDALARLAAGLHAAGFVHRDLHLRNLLVTEGARAPRPWVLDAWRGGPRRGLRGPAYDLACLFLQGAALLDPHEQARLLRHYAEARGGLDPARLARAAARTRARLVRRLARRPPRADEPPPLPAWRPPLPGRS